MNQLEMLGVTLLNQCNIWCAYCYNAKNSEGAFEKASFLHDKSQVSIDEVKSLIDKAIPLGLKDVQLSGGEPLIRYKDVLELVRYCHSRGLTVGIFTNAILARPERIRELKEAGLSWVRISLGGATYEAHSRERGGTRANFDHMLAHIRTFVQEGIPTGLFCPMVRSSRPDELVAAAELAADLGVNYIIFDGYIPSGIPDQDAAGFMSVEQHYECLEAVIKARRRLKDRIEIIFYYGAFEYTSPEWNEDEGLYPCKNGRNRLSLDADGGIRPSLSNARVIGDMRTPDFDLQHLWTTHPELHVIRTPQPCEPCISCVRWEVCQGSDDSHTFNLRRGESGAPPTCPVVRQYDSLMQYGMDSQSAKQRALRHLYRLSPVVADELMSKVD